MFVFVVVDPLVSVFVGKIVILFLAVKIFLVSFPPSSLLVFVIGVQVAYQGRPARPVSSLVKNYKSVRQRITIRGRTWLRARFVQSKFRIYELRVARNLQAINSELSRAYFIQ